MANNFELPIFKKAFDLYKEIHLTRDNISKKDCFTIWNHCENLILEIIKNFLLAFNASGENKANKLSGASEQINVLRIFLRLAKEVKTINDKKYINLQTQIDEIGRMLGGWIKSPAKEKPSLPRELFKR
jgi:four helix bundle protein